MLLPVDKQEVLVTAAVALLVSRSMLFNQQIVVRPLNQTIFGGMKATRRMGDFMAVLFVLKETIL
jgi:hypothetical protein